MELSYSFHLGSDRNKRLSSRNLARGNNSNSTSLSNNAIQNLRALSKADRHNLRKYDDDENLITVIKGTGNIVHDTKKTYDDLFSESLKKYNDKQTRNDRKIDDYFDHVSNDKEHDLACEIIIELGDMDYWNDKDEEERHKMDDVFKDQVEALELTLPNFKVANATIHYDETSPHLHIIGVPFKDNCKRGLERQVGKSSVFTKDTLSNTQDEMRQYCIDSFNKVYDKDYTLKDKEKGRNVDINISDMGNYSQIKKEKEKYKKKLNELNNKTDKLHDASNNITNMIDNLKTSKLNKDNLIISKENVDKIKDYIILTDEATSNLKDSNDLISILDKYEKDLKTHSNEVKKLETKIEVRDDEIDKLNTKLYHQEYVIDELKDEVSRLKQVVEYFKELWDKVLQYFKDKFYSSNMYDNMINEMEDKNIFTEKDIDKITGQEDIKKDDFEL